MASGVSIGTIDGATLQRAISSGAGGGNLVAVPNLPGLIIRLYKATISVASSTNVSFTSSGGSVLSGLIQFVSGAGTVVLPFDGTPWVQTNPGDGLQVNSSGAVQVSTTLYFTQNNVGNPP